MDEDLAPQPHTIIRAMDMLIRRGQETQDFTEEELAKIRKVRDLCLTDVELIREARVLLAEKKHRLARKEQSLSAFMEKLSTEDLESPAIKKMLEYFMSRYIVLDDSIHKIERMLDRMYPNWSADRSPKSEGKSRSMSEKKKSVSLPLSSVGSSVNMKSEWRSVEQRLDDVLLAMDGAERGGGGGGGGDGESGEGWGAEESGEGVHSTGTQTSEDDMPTMEYLDDEDEGELDVTQSSLDLDDSDPVV